MAIKIVLKNKKIITVDDCCYRDTNWRFIIDERNIFIRITRGLAEDTKGKKVGTIPAKIWKEALQIREMNKKIADEILEGEAKRTVEYEKRKWEEAEKRKKELEKMTVAEKKEFEENDDNWLKGLDDPSGFAAGYDVDEGE